jgi:hypothetical protein
MNKKITNLKKLNSGVGFYFKLFYALEYVAKSLLLSMVLLIIELQFIKEELFTTSLGVAILIIGLLLWASIYNDFYNKLKGVDNK